VEEGALSSLKVTPKRHGCTPASVLCPLPPPGARLLHGHSTPYLAEWVWHKCELSVLILMMVWGSQTRVVGSMAPAEPQLRSAGNRKEEQSWPWPLCFLDRMLCEVNSLERSHHPGSESALSHSS
jgi:hypothetical protein